MNDALWTVSFSPGWNRRFLLIVLVRLAHEPTRVPSGANDRRAVLDLLKIIVAAGRNAVSRNTEQSEWKRNY